MGLMRRPGILIDILLNLRWLQPPTTAGHFHHLLHQVRMRNDLATFHDTHDRRLRLQVTICCHPFVRRLVLLLRFLQLDLVDLDSHLGVCEPRVVCKLIRPLHLPTLRCLAEHSVFGTGQRLQRTLQLCIRCI